MRNYLVLLCIVAIISLAACVGNRLKARTLQVDSASLSKLQMFIPRLFWIDQSGRQGNQFVAFRSRNNTYLSCNQGNLTLDALNITRNEMFTPEMLDDNKIALKFMDGKYLGYMNQTFRCDFPRTDAAHIKFEKNIDASRLTFFSTSSSNMTHGDTSSSNATSTNLTLTTPRDRNEYLAFHLDNGYLGFMDNMLMLVPGLNLDAVFMPPMMLNTTSS